MDTSAEIRSRAVKLLTTREHSRQELARKLLARAYAADDIDAVLDQLERDDLLSESRLVEQYVAERLQKGFGPVRIRFELREKGLSDTRIEPHLQLEDERCLALIGAAHDRRFGAGSREERQTLAKRARFLEYRGFPSHLIARFLDADS
jgi:regulatory protein